MKSKKYKRKDIDEDKRKKSYINHYNSSHDNILSFWTPFMKIIKYNILNYTNIKKWFFKSALDFFNLKNRYRFLNNILIIIKISI